MSDALLAWRPEFPILDTCTYLVSHSLGAMPRRARQSLIAFADAWDGRGVQAWHEGWWEAGRETGNLLAPILGARRDSVVMHQNASIGQALVASCFSYDGPRRRIVLQDLDFPTNHYVLGGFRRYGADIVVVPSDDPVRAPMERLVDAIDDRTAFVVLSLVLFRSAHLQDPAPAIEKAHRVGAHVVLDVYQAAGAIPLNLEALGVDFAVGGSVKWLCGGPGAGYLYVRPDLIAQFTPAIAGWAAHAAPFQFEVGPLRPAHGIDRFQTGTPNVPALYSARAGYEIVGEVGVPAIRARSLELTRRLIDAALARGWRVNTPLDDRERGGSVVLDVPNGQAVTAELLRRRVIVDHRPDAGIRIAPHFYNTADEVDRAVAEIDRILERAA